MSRIATITLVAIAAAVAVTPALAADTVADGFERMFDHQPYHGSTATTVRAERDPLAGAVAAALQRSAAAIARHTGSADPVVASFERLFDHRPHHGPTAAAPQSERDPLIAAIVLPLLREQLTDQRLAGVTRRGAN